ncbi:MAG: MBL fold metallo-hydrolase [Acidobacteriia bacterium]|nr:MBL fold metallo-hydrolase [Terriglobia bacterium]
MNPICVTCGTQYADSSRWPEHCLICEDERQYIGLDGQKWTVLEELRRDHHNQMQLEEPGLASLVTEPTFAIGQRAFVVQTGEGNLLWDCLAVLDSSTIDHVRGLGGVTAIAISHPHYYTTLVEWSRAFGNARVLLHQADREWVMRPDPCIEFWNGDSRALFGGLSLIRCGGHFPGGTVLHWPSGAEGKGALLTGDILQVVPDRRWVSFMYSYPNYIPLDAAGVQGIEAAVESVSFDRIYGAFRRMTVAQDGKMAVRRSVDRYLRAMGVSRREGRSIKP